MKIKGEKRGITLSMASSQKTINEIKIKLPSLSVNEGVARTVCAAFCSQLDPTTTEIADIKCAVSEAVTNCIVHAYRDTIGIIYITARICEDKIVRIDIKDKGCGIPDIEKAMEPLYTSAPLEERAGLGFAVMQSFTDTLTVKSEPGKGTVITMRKKTGENDE